MMTPRVISWFDVIEVSTYLNIAVEVHVGTTSDFTPSADTYQGILYAPGTFHVIGTTASVDHYVRFVSLDGEDVSEIAGPVQTTAIA